ncbi:hypothetical protein L9F63_010759, partial [Diploptera punctata]
MKTLIDSSVERTDGFSEYLKDQQSVTFMCSAVKCTLGRVLLLHLKKQHEMEQASTYEISPPQ